MLGVVEAALQGGLTLVQYRDKTSEEGVKLATVRQLCELCHRYDALLIVNDRVDLAIAADADGVHLGQQDRPVAEARQLLARDASSVVRLRMPRKCSEPLKREQIILEFLRLPHS